METERKASDHDDEDDGHCQEGVDDVLEEDDVLPDPIQEAHVEEKVHPGEGDSDRTDLKMVARRRKDEVVGGDNDGQAVHERVEEEDCGKGWVLPVECFELV